MASKLHQRYKRTIEIIPIMPQVGEAGVIITLNFTQLKELASVYERRIVQDIYHVQSGKADRTKQLGFQIPRSEVYSLLETLKKYPSRKILSRMAYSLEDWLEAQNVV